MNCRLSWRGIVTHPATLKKHVPPQLAKKTTRSKIASGAPGLNVQIVDGPADNGLFSHTVDGAGDVDGDGFDDVIIGSPASATEENGLVTVCFGSPDGLDRSRDWTFVNHRPAVSFGHQVAGAGDVNGDGFADIVLGVPRFLDRDAGALMAFYGSSSGLPEIPDWQVQADVPLSDLGFTVGAAGDVNGDGFGDLIVGQSYFSGDHELAGRALVYFGSKMGLAGGSFWRPPGQEFGFEFRSVVLPFPNLAWTVAFLLAVLGGMFALTRFYYQRRERLAADVQVNRDAALREERMRISQDLHDQLGAHLTGIALATGNVRRAVSGAGEKVDQSLSGIETTASQLVDTLAEIVWLTKPTTDSLEQLVNYLLDHTSKELEPAGITCYFDVPSRLPVSIIDYDLLLSVKEALHNLVKHSGAARMTLTVRTVDACAVFEITDDGAGFKGSPDAVHGNGLANMHARMKRHGGKFEINTDRKGTTVRLTVPISADKKSS
jgi:signal transduction histidine kinase